MANSGAFQKKSPLGLSPQAQKQYEQAIIDQKTQPKRPKDQRTTDKQGNLLDNFKINYGPDVMANRDALNMLRQQSMATGPSVWAQQALQAQGLENQGMRESADRQAAAQKASAWSDLAQHGGLSGGARERVSMNAARDQAQARQLANRQASQANMGILSQDTAAKQAMLSAQPGLENQAFQQDLTNKQGNLMTQQYNMGNALHDIGASNESAMNAYNEQMKAWAANKTADAQANAGKK